jgi:uncharacterized protein (DUF1499 family)
MICKAVVLCLAVPFLTHAAAEEAASMPPKELLPCPSTPNCVSSQSSDSDHRVEPLHYESSGEEAWRRLRQVVLSLPRSRVIEDASGYMRVEFRSPVLQFVDDVELLLDEANKAIQVRSASRTGYWDSGVNRKRVERIRSQFRNSLDTAK